MLLPIALAVGEMFRPKDHVGAFNFGVTLMLGVAYAASIGGIATLIGTPTNVVLAGAASEMLGREIGFLGVDGRRHSCHRDHDPHDMVPARKMLYPAGRLTGDAAAILAEERARLGPPSRGEKSREPSSR